MKNKTLLTLTTTTLITLTACTNNTPQPPQPTENHTTNTPQEIHKAYTHPNTTTHDYITTLANKSIQANLKKTEANLTYDQTITAAHTLCNNEKAYNYFRGNFLENNESIQKVYKYKQQDLNNALDTYDNDLTQQGNADALVSAAFVAAPFACPDKYTDEDTKKLSEIIDEAINAPQKTNEKKNEKPAPND